jgi:hypothetical protein
MRADSLVPVDELATLDDEILHRARNLGLAIEVSSDAAGLALARALMFERWPELSGVDPERAFYNRYFWFRRCASLWQAAHGDDDGIEQQVLQILEHAELDVDWALVEELDRAARADVHR